MMLYFLQRRRNFNRKHHRNINFSRHLAFLLVLYVIPVVSASPVKRSMRECFVTFSNALDLQTLSISLTDDMGNANRIQNATGVNGLDPIVTNLNYLRIDLNASNEGLWIRNVSRYCQLFTAAISHVIAKEVEISNLSNLVSFGRSLTTLNSKLESLTRNLRNWMSSKGIENVEYDDRVWYNTPCDATCLAQRNFYVVNLFKDLIREICLKKQHFLPSSG